MSWETSADLVVVGSGVAGLTAALAARRAGLRVVVVTKDVPEEGSTRWAQGGIAVVLGDVTGDTVGAHLGDTVAAGGGLVDAVAAGAILRAGPAAVAALRAEGAVFDGAPERLARGREGGHSAYRVVHAGGDATGAEVERALLAAARREELTVLAGHAAVAVLTGADGSVRGLEVRDADGTAGRLAAPAVLLATGGVGGLYETTTNPAVATADGWALALRAGATLADVEFVQFHPTALFTGRSSTGRAPLVTEALRGEGAVLRDTAGASVTAGVHPLGDLAPRDVVAAAITRRISELGAEHVWLDATGVPDVAARFPTVAGACAAIGVDLAADPVPVRPAAHYSCGGVVTDTRGCTGVPGLWAAGEVARTGLHGANRLASNSLLEGLVVGGRAAEDITAALAGPRRLAAAVETATAPVPVADRRVLQGAMTRGAGIGRDAAGLAAASDAVEAASAVRVPRTRAQVEDANLTLAAHALLAAAGSRTETRGCHVRHDHPATDDHWQRASSTVVLDGDGRLHVGTTDARHGGVA
ncbi:L-aspartate oxidase [Actinomycetospora sp. NBRC 106375]|uniref:L-aspartate oxidase n=1 Tax=Actinomycetospora sp. NBRC 106375 TaxID=3032207 RepID=UPI0024A29B38|nr:L-aspartate oxidase [Actinomycetospora sp. NBRC 106375]GLZ47324.1 L-aspartate oxidase [Actinomycetospora sp. NBRC 106375]